MSPADSTIVMGNQILKVRLAAYRGRVIFDIRYFYQPSDGGALRPGRRGITLPACNLHDVIMALDALKAEMIEDGALEYTEPANPPKFHPHVYPNDF